MAHPDTTTDPVRPTRAPPPRSSCARRGPEDRDAFIAAMQASAELHRPWVTPPVTAPEFDAWLTRAARADFDANLAVRAADGAIVGYFNISQIIRGPLQSAFLGYGGVAEWSGAGYMTAALRLVVERAFTDLALHRIEANIQPANARLDRPGRALRLRPRGLLRALPEDRRPLARPRALRDPSRAVARADPLRLGGSRTR